MCEKEKVVVLIPHLGVKRIKPLSKVSSIDKYGLDGCRIETEKFRSQHNNEDPYIWTPQFLYSFCHANIALKKSTLDTIQDFDTYFCFFSRNELDLLQIDTVIMGQHILKWGERPAGGREKNSVRSILKDYIQKKGISVLDSEEILNDIMDCHLPFDEYGMMNEHDNKKVHTIVGDKENSFLPLVKNNDSPTEYVPYYFDESDSKKIKRLFKRRKENSRYYVVTKDSIEDYVKNNPETKLLNDYFKKIERKIVDEVIRGKRTDIRKITSEQLYPLYIDYKETFRSC